MLKWFKSDASADSATPARGFNLLRDALLRQVRRLRLSAIEKTLVVSRWPRLQLIPEQLADPARGDAVGQSWQEPAHEHQEFALHRQADLVPAVLDGSQRRGSHFLRLHAAQMIDRMREHDAYDEVRLGRYLGTIRAQVARLTRLIGSLLAGLWPSCEWSVTQVPGLPA